jgi:uncharacterized membrane protein YdfJ with MMPL/SSD domain
MPTLFRFAVILAVLAGLAYGTMFALVMFVEPKQTELSVKIPPDRLDPARKPGSGIAEPGMVEQ